MSQFSGFHWLIVGLVVLVLYKAVMSGKGRPAKFCKSCGHTGPTDAHTPGNILIEIILWLCLIVPGLIYSIWRVSSRASKCEKCGSLELVPVDSPVAVAARQQLGQPAPVAGQTWK